MQNKGPNELMRKMKSLMKLSVLLFSILLTTISGANANDVYTQDVLDKAVSIDLKDVVLKDALEKISTVANVSFVYVSNPVLNNTKINLQANGQKLGVLLKKLLYPYSLNYIVVDDHIVIKTETDLKEKATSQVTDPIGGLALIDVKGIVTADNDTPLMGVSVVVKGTQRGVVTNANGEFELKGVSNDAVLVISMTGYKLQEIKAESFKGSPIKIQLKQEAASLQEVVVTGFQSIDKKKFTGASTRLKI